MNSAPFERASREALAITDAEDRDAALYDLAFELRKRGLHDEALHVLAHIADGYIPDRISLASVIAIDLSGLGSTERADATLRDLESLIDRCEWAALPGAILDLVKAYTSLRYVDRAERLLERLDNVLSVDVRREDTQLWVDTEKYKAEGAQAWATVGNKSRAEALARRIQIDHIRNRVLSALRGSNKSRTPPVSDNNRNPKVR